MNQTDGWQRMSVDLVSWSNNPQAAALAAGVCYDAKNPQKSLEHAMSGGHESVVEHVSYTFRIRGISRACLAQLTRHRIASFSVRSQRYTNQEDSEVVCPKSVQNNMELLLFWHKTYMQPQTESMSFEYILEEFSSSYNLSSREVGVLKLLLERKSNGEIASELNISESTVKFHVKNILRKTGCSNRNDLISTFYS